MARAHDEYNSLRFGRRECERVIVAVLLSIIMHFTFLAGYLVGAKEGWWTELQPPHWLHFFTKKRDLEADIGHDRPPSIFVDVSHADSDAPTRTPFYSNKNSRASNPDEGNSNVPKVSGTQRDMAKTETVTKLVRQEGTAPTEGVKSKTPSDAPKEPPKETKPDSKPQLAKLEPYFMPPPSLAPIKPVETQESPQTPGETEKPKPQKDAPPAPPAPNQPQPQPVAERPRTIKQALAQHDQLPGVQMRQEGGVPRRTPYASLDVKNTAFGDYDRELIAAVQQRWDDLLDNHRYAQDRDGKVILRFKLKPDGSVIEMQTLENTVGEVLGYLCQESIEEAAPFAKWPSDMAREIGTNYRDITFTFYYY